MKFLPPYLAAAMRGRYNLRSSGATNMKWLIMACAVALLALLAVTDGDLLNLQFGQQAAAPVHYAPGANYDVSARRRQPIDRPEN